MVVQTLDTAGGYVLGFRVDPQDKLPDIFKEIDSFFAVYRAAPIFGVVYERIDVS